ncbi:fasciclin [Jannaschia sp. EhC01]|nr:fasciclin [Jannaschia sp. EhC01]
MTLNSHFLARPVAAALAGGAMVALVASGAVAQSNPTVGGAPMLAERNIVENAVNSPIHTTLVAAVVEAGLAETLSGEGPFTVFAPTDDAFAALPEGAVAALLEPANRGRLTQILTCHVVAAEAFSSAIGGMIADDSGAHPIETVGGCVFTARMMNGQIMIEDEQGRMATVTIADVDQSNGVIHVIDTVLLPPAS